MPGARGRGRSCPECGAPIAGWRAATCSPACAKVRRRRQYRAAYYGMLERDAGRVCGVRKTRRQKPGYYAAVIDRRRVKRETDPAWAEHERARQRSYWAEATGEQRRRRRTANRRSYHRALERIAALPEPARGRAFEAWLAIRRDRNRRTLAKLRADPARYDAFLAAVRDMRRRRVLRRLLDSIDMETTDVTSI